ncbi:MAG: hypothetical protein JKY95_16180 [Planctomycetaceae bacterium]|nr:hypothetical protein [Planctomycetaceae bacterium]
MKLFMSSLKVDRRFIYRGCAIAVVVMSLIGVLALKNHPVEQIVLRHNGNVTYNNIYRRPFNGIISAIELITGPLNATRQIDTVLVISNSITKDEIQAIIRRSQPVELVIACENLEDDALSGIHSSERLRYLQVYSKKLTDKGVDHISDCTGLSTLVVYSDKITNESIVTVSQMKNLSGVSMCSREVNDTNIENLRSLKKLSGLCLSHTNITDKSIDILATFSSLIDLEICDTDVAPRRVEELKMSRPDLTIRYNEPPLEWPTYGWATD